MTTITEQVGKNAEAAKGKQKITPKKKTKAEIVKEEAAHQKQLADSYLKLKGLLKERAQILLDKHESMDR